jgi:hypothetical protein
MCRLNYTMSKFANYGVIFATVAAVASNIIISIVSHFHSITLCVV